MDMNHCFAEWKESIFCAPQKKKGITVLNASVNTFLLENESILS